MLVNYWDFLFHSPEVPLELPLTDTRRRLREIRGNENFYERVTWRQNYNRWLQEESNRLVKGSL